MDPGLRRDDGSIEVGVALLALHLTRALPHGSEAYGFDFCRSTRALPAPD